MDSSEAQKCDVAPATATAYLDPNYWSAAHLRLRNMHMFI